MLARQNMPKGSLTKDLIPDLTRLPLWIPSHGRVRWQKIPYLQADSLLLNS
jgi:hypothetical protein